MKHKPLVIHFALTLVLAACNAERSLAPDTGPNADTSASLVSRPKADLAQMPLSRQKNESSPVASGTSQMTVPSTSTPEPRLAMSAPPPVAQGYLWGRVVSEETGQGEADVSITLNEGPSSGHHSASTNDDGSFRIDGLQPGIYALNLEKAGFEPVRRRLEITTSGVKQTFNLIARHWTRQNTGTSSDLHDVDFIDENTGFVVGESTLLKTKDGGKTWTQLPLHDLMHNLYSVDFVDSSQGWIADLDQGIFKTSDGGLNWTKQESDFSIPCHQLQMFSEKLGFAMSNDTLKQTSDGQNWQSIHHESIYAGLIKFHFLSPQIGLMNAGQLPHLTTDGGSNWQRLSETYFMNRLYAIDKSTFVAVGSEENWFYRSDDAGASWERRNITSLENNQHGMVDLAFNSRTSGYAIPYWGAAVYSTADGGKTWQKKSTGQTFEAKRIKFFNSKQGWIVGSKGTLLKF